MKPGVLRIFPQTGAVARASADSSYLSTPLRDRRWQVALTQMSFHAHGREIRSDRAVLAEDFLRERRGGTQRGKGRISLYMWKMCMWGNEPVESQHGLMGNMHAGRWRLQQGLLLVSFSCFKSIAFDPCSSLACYQLVLGPLVEAVSLEGLQKVLKHMSLKQQVQRVPWHTSGHVGDTEMSRRDWWVVKIDSLRWSYFCSMKVFVLFYLLLFAALILPSFGSFGRLHLSLSFLLPTRPPTRPSIRPH